MSNKFLKRKNLLSFEKLESRAMMAITPVIPPDVFDSIPFNNDSQAAAGPLGAITGTLVVPNLTMEDQFDWFSFSMTQQGDATSNVKIEFSTLLGDLDVSLYTVRGTRIRNSANGTDVETFPLQNVPAVDASTGLPITYFIKVIGFGSVFNPNYKLTITTASAPIIDPAAKAVDLVGGWLNVDDAGIWGKEISVQAKVKNLGTSDSATSGTPSRPTTAGTGVQVSFYLSKDEKVSADDILLPLTNFITTLNFPAVGAKSTSAAKNARVTLPTTLPAGWSGTFFYVVAFVDAPNFVVETNELNNSGQVGQRLDWEPISVFSTLDTPQASYFNIQINPVGMTPRQVQIFEAAAARWEAIIIGDLPNYQTSPGIIVDDLMITATITAIDGAGGILGGANPVILRDQSQGGLPATGNMIFDSADIAGMEADGSFLNTLTHEMGHVLGIGSLWDAFGLVQGVNGPYPTYTGSQGVAGFNKVSGFAPVSAVPIEAEGGQGTAYSHWDEDLMQNEMMTPFAGPNNYEPISAATVGSLADMGYKVNFNAAEKYDMRALPQRIAGPLIPFPHLPVGFQGRSARRASEEITGDMNLGNTTTSLSSGPITVASRSSLSPSSSSSSSNRGPLLATALNTNLTTTSFVNRNETSDKSDARKELDDIFGSL